MKLRSARNSGGRPGSSRVAGASPDAANASPSRDPGPSAAATLPPSLDAAGGARISLTLTPDGAFDLDAMRAGSRERVIKAVRLTKLPGAGSDAADLAALKALASTLAGTVGMISVSLARAAGYTAQQAATLAFDASERAMLADPGARVLLKYQGSLTYVDEMALASALLILLSTKITHLRSLASDALDPPDRPTSATQESVQ